MAKYAPLPLSRAREIEAHLDLMVRGLKSGPHVAWANKPLEKMSADAYQFVVDCLSMGMGFFEAFKQIKNGKLIPDRDDRRLVVWVRSPDANLRSGRIVANMMAFEYCALLEDLLPKLVQYGKTHSSEFLRQWKILGGSKIPVRPSGRRAAAWPELLLHLFGLPSDPLIAEALQDLKGARNCAAHELPLQEQAYWGEHVKIWGTATVWLFGSLTQELDALVH